MHDVNTFARPPGEFVAYYMLGVPGLTVEVDRQRGIVAEYALSNGALIIDEFVEQRAIADRMLRLAFRVARRRDAWMLFHDLNPRDRAEPLGRDFRFIARLISCKLPFVAVGAPCLHKKNLPAFAAPFAKNRSETAVVALAKAREDGTLLGSNYPGHWDGIEHLQLDALKKGRAGSLKVRPEIRRRHLLEIGPKLKSLRDSGMTLQEVANHLNEHLVKTIRGRRWYPVRVGHYLKMLGDNQFSLDRGAA